jgi:predicted membrane protein
VSGFALLGGVNRRCVSQDFRGGSLTAIMGGCELDLRHASISSGQAVIDTFAFWGGIEIKVPQEWTVVVQGTPILGAFDDKTVRVGGDGSKVLVIKGVALMGGVDVKN